MFFYPLISFCQVVNISTDQMNIAYVGYDNHITVMVENMGCDDFFITVDNGYINKKSSCKYSYTPSSGFRNSLIKIHSLKCGNVIDSIYYNIKRIPEPYLTINNEKLKKEWDRFHGVFSGNDNLKLVCENFPFELNYSIISFDLVARINDSIYTSSNTGNEFSKRSKKIIEMCEDGQHIYLNKIKVLDPMGKPTYIYSTLITLELDTIR